MARSRRPKRPPIDIQDIFNAFHQNIRASIETILQINAQKLNDASPPDFIFVYCSKPLETLGIKVVDAEIRREEELHL